MDDVRQGADSSERLNRLVGGRYRLDAPIGRGGMGTVWSGTDELLNRPVAVKELVLPPSIPENEAANLRERALREARAMASLNHPNTVTLYDVAREDDQPFMVMELVRGLSLSTLIHEGRRLTDHQLAVIIDSTAAALNAAHRAGIVHRDVKPGNVLIGPDHVKLADFGLVRNAAEATMTSSKQILGTPAYIAPEMALHSDTSPAVDLWGLGATAFAAAEGRPPYDSSVDPLVTVSSIVYGPVPEHDQDGPIGEVISGLMVKEPENRMPLAEVRNRIHHLVRAAGPAPFETTPTATPPTNPSYPSIADTPGAPGPRTADPQAPGPHETGPAAADKATKVASEPSTIPMDQATPENSEPPARPPGTLQAATPGTLQAATPDPAGEKVPGRGKGSRLNTFIVLGVLLAVATVVVAVAIYLPGRTRTSADSTTQQPTQPSTPSAQIPPGFVPLPVRPTPLPDPVECHYVQNGKTATVKRPADGPVSSKGIVRATINTNMGAIPLLLDRSLAPCTVNSFISQARQGAFNQVRCVGGSAEWIRCGTGSSPGYRVENEGFDGEGHRRGYLMMDSADFSSPDTTFALLFGSSQLSQAYPVFGTISDEGLNVIDSVIRYGHTQLDKFLVTGVDIQD